MSMNSMKVLRIAAGIEAASLLALMANLLTIHAASVSSLGGPAHGAAYLISIAVTFSLTAADASTGARALSFVPGIGGMLALRRLAPHSRVAKPTLRARAGTAHAGPGN
ncbi:hypothetical protein [Streptomyces sp. NBC_01408]|uniref:hypothetical protein n=1 Tax=Streptomyces sp. NBC_01408 TaxID=2903855 RepID=UPI00224EE9E1|nr:hypothetical protein [Streptomyces sp. NBC_01408]MCX4696165.1 hypothetical protein [Streptomyces sp. NBC_01408]